MVIIEFWFTMGSFQTEHVRGHTGPCRHQLRKSKCAFLIPYLLVQSSSLPSLNLIFFISRYQSRQFTAATKQTLIHKCSIKCYVDG